MDSAPVARIIFYHGFQFFLFGYVLFLYLCSVVRFVLALSVKQTALKNCLLRGSGDGLGRMPQVV